MKQIDVTILGQGYILGCPPDGEPQLRQAVETVDREMSAIRDGGKVKARERIAVLAALNLAYKLADAPKSSASDQGAPSWTSAEIDSLIRRIDATLGADGQLL
jgi:cell division protein ZapA